MSLKNARRGLWGFCLLMGLLLMVGSWTRQPGWLYGGLAAAVAGAVFWLIFGRCPTCGRFLGRSDGSYCPHCGSKLPWE